MCANIPKCDYFQYPANKKILGTLILPPYSQLDNEMLDALPEAIRHEILSKYKTSRISNSPVLPENKRTADFPDTPQSPPSLSSDSHTPNHLLDLQHWLYSEHVDISRLSVRTMAVFLSKRSRVLLIDYANCLSQIWNLSLCFCDAFASRTFCFKC